MRWSTQKTIDYLIVKKPTITLKQHFFDQLIYFEDYIKKRFNFSLSRDWQSKPYNSEEQTLSNTYLNTIQKKAKSPRASTYDRPGEKRTGVTWNKKIKQVIPIKYLNNVISSAENPQNHQSASDTPIHSQKKPQNSMTDDNISVDAVSQKTQKKPLNVILKSKSMRALEQNTPSPLGYDNQAEGGNTGDVGVSSFKLVNGRHSAGAQGRSDRESESAFRRNSSQPGEVLYSRDGDNIYKHPTRYKDRINSLKIKVQAEADPDGRISKVPGSEFGKF